MKSAKLIMTALLSFAAASAYADSFQLNYINTNNCQRAVSLVRLLSTPQIRVNPICHGPGQFPSDQGPVYSYRVVTTVDTPFYVNPGQILRLDDIYTNNCSFAQSEVRLLHTQQYSIRALCSPPGQYMSSNGKVFRYRMKTEVRKNF